MDTILPVGGIGLKTGLPDAYGVTARMRQHMQDQNSAAGGGVRIPSPAELEVLTEYLAGHGADAQGRP